MGAIDSSADLLFKISADSSDAEGNIRRFRTLMSKDLSDIKAESADWAKKVFGDVSTAQGGMLAAGAALAAGAVAAGTALVKAATDAQQYALEVGKGSARTGIAVEDMSRLRFAAQEMGVSYDSLVTGLTRFASTVDKARDSSSQQAAAFHRMGISQQEIEAGSKNLLPLLMSVTDAFQGQMTKVERTAMSRELFSRGGAELIAMLSRGSGVIREFGDEAERLGLVFTEQDVVAAKELRAEMNYLHAQSEALWLSIGRWALPNVTNMVGGLESLAGGIKFALAGVGGSNPLEQFLTGFDVTAKAAVERLQKQVKAGLMTGEGLGAPGAEAAKVATQNFTGLSSILDQVRMKLASAQGEEDKFTEETRQMQESVNKAAAELIKLRDEGKITPETLAREMAALQELPTAMGAAIEAQIKEMQDKRKAAVLAATADLRTQLAQMQPGSAAQEHAAWDAEMDQRVAVHKRQQRYEGENVTLLAEIRAEGHRKIERDQSDSFARQLTDLQRDLAEMVTAHFTARERVDWIYEQDLQRFSESEEAKTLATATSEAQREAIRQQYDMNRKAAYDRHASDLLALKRSEGWEGVFGGAFAEMIRGDEQLLRDWTYSTEQRGMIVQVAMSGLSQSAQKAFGAFASGMGQNISQSIVYSKSIGEAMRAAVASTLAGLAAEAMVYAIYSTGLGFLRLAQYDYGAASEAFTAAAVWGAVGGAAAIAGRAIAPAQGKAGGEAAAGGSSVAGSSGGSGGSSEAGGQGTRVAIYVQGNIVGRAGIEELTEIINEAVKDRDVKLIATAVKQSGQVTL